jgi:hypothetical protein
MVAAIIFGPYGWLAILLWVAGLILAVPHWVAALRRPRPARLRATPDPQEKTVPKAEARLDDEAALWEQRVVPNNPAFKKTYLTGVRPVPDGYTATIVGDRGATRFSQLSSTAAVETIASAHGVHISQVSVEEDDDRDTSRARVTVIRSDTNLQGEMWLEDVGAAIDPKTGIAQIGRYFDLAPAHRQFFTPSGGAQMGVVVGDTGTGKSGHGSALLALCHRSPLTVAALLDPQGGSSQPDWAGKTPIYAEGHDDVMERLRMLDFVMVKRADYVAHAPWVDDQGRERCGKPYLLPGDPDLDGMPMIVTFLEELKFFLSSPWGKEALILLGNAVRTWRKPGGSLIVFNQNLGLDNFGSDGQSQSFRANLVSGGSLAAFRTGSSQDHAMVGLPADPSRLPEYFRDGSKTHGLGYLTGIDRRPSAPWRAIPVRDAFGIASTPAAAKLDERTLGWVEEWKHHQGRGRDPKEAAVPKRASTPRRTSGDVQSAVERVLAASGKPLEVGEICVRVQRELGEVRLSEIPAALRTLAKGEVVRLRDDAYELVPAGR